MRCSAAPRSASPGWSCTPAPTWDGAKPPAWSALPRPFAVIFAEAPAEVTVLLENTAGQGTYLGGRFEHLAEIMDRVPEGRFGICFDTCHAFAAGYDLATAEGYAAVMEEFDRQIGLDHLRAFHLNDAKKGLGSRVDRHEHIGQGAIGRAGFGALLRDPRFRDVPKILETPKGDGRCLRSHESRHPARTGGGRGLKDAGGAAAGGVGARSPSRGRRWERSAAGCWSCSA